MAIRQAATGNGYSLSTTSASRGLTVAGWLCLRADRNDYTSFFEHWNSYNNMLGLITPSDGTTLECFVSAYTELSLGALLIDRWYYAGIQSDSAGNARGFISTPGGGPLTFTSTSSIPSYNGTLYFLTDSDAEWANGSVENWRLWSDYLDPNELLEEMLSPYPRRTGKLWGWWRLQNPDDFGDLSGNGRRLTRSGSAQRTEPGPAGPWAYNGAIWTKRTVGPAPITGTSTVTLDAPTLDADGEVGSVNPTGTAAAIVPELVAAASGGLGIVGTSEPTVPGLVVAAVGAHTPPGAIGGTADCVVPALTVAASGSEGIAGTSAAVVPEVTANATGTAGSSGSVPTVGVSALGYLVFNTGPSFITTSPPVDTQPTGSIICCGAGIYELATEGAAPTDNKGNTYTQAGTTIEYPNYAGSGCKIWIKSGATGGTGHTWTKTCNPGSESTVMAVECKNANAVAATSSVGRGSAGQNGSFTSLSVTVDGPAVLLCFFFGELYFTAHPTATGWVREQSYLGEGAAIQGSIFSRTVTDAGTYSCTVQTTGPSQGAILYMVAIQGITHTGTAAVTVTPPTLAASGAVRISGTGAAIVPVPAAAASGAEVIRGPSAASVPALTVAASGEVVGPIGVTGSAEVTLSSPTLAASGSIAIVGSAAAQISLTAEAAGAEGIPGVAAASVPVPVASSVAAVVISGTSTAAIPDPTVAALGSVVTADMIAGPAALVVPEVTAGATGTVGIAGAATVALAPATASGEGWVSARGAAAVVLDGPTASAVGTESMLGSAAATVPGVAVAATGSVYAPGDVHGTAAASIGVPVAAAVGVESLAGTAEAEAPSPIAWAVGRVTGEGVGGDEFEPLAVGLFIL